jgi:2-polyprenyl-3-methyl-5-hydroxy-6-metoxy-1,4-benzoquinol methylase
MCQSTRVDLSTRRVVNETVYHLAKCRDCEQHFCSPTPTQEAIVAFYEGDYHTELRTPGGSEKAFGEKFRRYCAFVLQHVKPGRSLDIGTATGLLPSQLKAAGFDAEGSEYNRDSAEWGQSHFGVRIWHGDLAENHLEHGIYDFISMTDVLEHTQHPLHYLQDVKQYLKPQGHMMITFPDITSLESRYTYFCGKVLGRPWIWSCCHVPLHVWEFTPETATRLFEKAGFRVVAFQRFQEPLEVATGFLGLVRLPLKLLMLPQFRRMFGTQMEFIIQRSES